MKPITFIDTETGSGAMAIQSLGAVKVDGATFHSNSIGDFTGFIKGSTFLCGHNIIEHDLKYLAKYVDLKGFVFIDTLFLSALLFPAKPYHRLLKDDKQQTGGNTVNGEVFLR